MLKELTPTLATIKFICGLRLAEAGVFTFEEVAARLGVSRGFISQILSGDRQTPSAQRAIAEICGCRPVEIFGAITHPSLVSCGNGSPDDAGRIRGMLRAAGLSMRRLAAEAGVPWSTARSLLTGRRHNAHGQYMIAAAYRRLAGTETTMVQFWGRLTAKEVA